MDLVLRNQNEVAKAGTERRYKGQSRKRTQNPDESTSNALTVHSSLPENGDFYAHTFFVTAYVTTPRDPRAEHGFLEILPHLFDKLPSNSALSSALAAVAHSYFGAWEPAIRNAEHLTVQKNYTKALGALQVALQDPRECVSDATLMAVCLLAYFEVC